MLSSRYQSERGAMLIVVAVGSLVLIAFTMFVVDYGVLWVSRHQAQNSADSGALAGATALAFDDLDNFDDDGPARQSARSFAVSNDVWDQDPDITIDGDIRFSQEAFNASIFPDECEIEHCVRVDVFRNQDRGNPLPMWFGQLVGLNDQGVRAMAIARAGFGSFSTRVRPWALPDRWEELCSPDPDDWEFNLIPDCGATIQDRYESCASGSGTCTGYNPEDDLGRAFVLKRGSPHDAISPSHFNPVVLPGTGTGGSEYRESIAEGGDLAIGDVIPIEPGNMIGPTGQGMGDLLALDPDAYWWASGGADGRGCVSRTGITPPRCVDSPRIVCVGVFDPALYFDSRMHGRMDVTITNLLGFFVEPQGTDVGVDIVNDDDDVVDNQDVVGWLTYCPGDSRGPSPEPGPYSFIRFVQLVR